MTVCNIGAAHFVYHLTHAVFVGGFDLLYLDVVAERQLLYGHIRIRDLRLGIVVVQLCRVVDVMLCRKVYDL